MVVRCPPLPKYVNGNFKQGVSKKENVQWKKKTEEKLDKSRKSGHYKKYIKEKKLQ